MPNKLAGEKSPYLVQHANNPVNWYPWGEEAFRKASDEDKPIFLSIGYSTCHWCHVMEHESFEDDEVAAILNEHYVAIKVDREERPDVDQVYMTVCQATTGSGGWPLSIFMAPDRKPFFAGSYFPKAGRLGMPGFMDILRQLAVLWKDRRDQLGRIGDEITTAIQPKPPEDGRGVPGLEVLERAYNQLHQGFDSERGGFGGAPKFPSPHNLTFLLRWHKRRPSSAAAAMVEKTLDSMRAGGIFDHVGFGFHRYSVDDRWLVPHFEKMLYDQAMLTLAYTEAALATRNPLHGRVAAEIIEYVLRDMTSPEGGFYSAEDADSEGREGVFYTWTPTAVAQVLDKESADLFCRVFDISVQGNFEEGQSIPHLRRPIAQIAREMGKDPAELENSLKGIRQKLFAAREKRIHPLKDDKILVAWNGLMIAALSRAYQAFGNQSHIKASQAAADFIVENMRPGGRLHRRYRHGEVAYPAYADDYAFLIWGLLELYESIFDTKYLQGAIELQEQMNALFEDGQNGGFFYSGRDAEGMIVREKPLHDGATPSANSVSALNLLRLGRMTGDSRFEKQADSLIRCFSGPLALFPPGYTHFLQAVDFLAGPSREIVLVGRREDERARGMICIVHRAFIPNRVLLFKPADEADVQAALAKLAPFTEAMNAPEDGAAAYVCQGFRCGTPVTDTSTLAEALEDK